MKGYLALLVLLGAVFVSDAMAQAGSTASSDESAAAEDEASAAGDAKDKEEADEGEGAEDAEDEDAGKPASVEKARTGDIITFKTGRILSSVQVVRETVTGVEVRVLSGAPPLKVPKDQIESIQYDDVDPNRPGQSAVTPGATGAQGVMTAQPLSPELSRKLAVPLAPEDLKVSGKPIIDTLLQLSSKAGFALEVAEPARQLDGASLVWKSDPPAGTTFSSLLQDFVVRDHPELVVVYSFDKIVLTTKSAAASVAAPADANVTAPPVPVPPSAAPAPGALSPQLPPLGPLTGSSGAGGN